MKKILLGLAALSVIGLSSVSVPTPAEAQPYGYHGSRTVHRHVAAPPRYHRHRHVRRAQVCTVRHVMKRDWRGRLVRSTVRTCR